jgi:hypothetical protein
MNNASLLMQTAGMAPMEFMVLCACRTQVNLLYDMLSKNDTAMAVLPDVVARLRALRAVHEQVPRFKQSSLNLLFVLVTVTAFSRISSCSGRRLR